MGKPELGKRATVATSKTWHVEDMIYCVYGDVVIGVDIDYVGEGVVEGVIVEIGNMPEMWEYAERDSDREG